MTQAIETLCRWRARAPRHELRSFGIGVGVDGVCVLRLVVIPPIPVKFFETSVQLTEEALLSCVADMFQFEVERAILQLPEGHR